MLLPDDERGVDDVSPAPPLDSTPTRAATSTMAGTLDDDDAGLAGAVRSLRALIMAGERYRLSMAAAVGLGTTESQAMSYLAVHGPRGQSDLARDLSLTSSASTALVDRLERHGVAERARHPTDRRRTIIRLTSRGEELAADGQAPLLATLGLVDAADLPLLTRWLGRIAGDLHARAI